MNKKIYIEDIAVSCSLGFEPKALLANLRSGEAPGLMVWDKPVYSGREAYVARVIHDLPTASEMDYANNRNNRLAHFLCQRIEAGVASLHQRYAAERIGVVIGSSTSGVETTESFTEQQAETGEMPLTYDYQHQDMGDVSQVVAKLIGAKGPVYTVSTACTSSTRAMISASKLIQSGICDAVVCGGVDTLCQLTVNGFDSLEQLSAEPCRPFDKQRNGINVAEGGALLIVTKDKSDVQLSGFGESADAHHLSSPIPCGTGAYQAMQMALTKAAVKPSDVGYINAHGTSTQQNDAMESAAIHKLFGNEVAVSSTKALTGHCLGAAGAVEAVICTLLLRANNEPIPIQWPLPRETDPALADIHLVQDTQIEALNHVMSNSFAFGGNNASIVLSAVGQRDE